MWRNERFCCCLSIWRGTMIIGCLLLLDLLIEIRFPNQIRLFIKSAAIASFVIMVWNDVEATRMAFFMIYCVNRTIELYIDIWTINEQLETLPEYTCTSNQVASSEAEKQAMKEEYDNCVYYAQSWSTTFIFLLSVGQIIVSIHFCMVLYSHWKNSALPKAMGGVANDPMNNAVIEMTDDDASD